jgi:mannan endo-1,4-beta-mannosidase
MTRRAFCAVIAAGALSVAAGTSRADALTRPVAIRAASASAPAPILTRLGSELLVRGQRRRLSGVNAYWVGLNDNARDGGGAPTLPSHAQLTATFSGISAMGASLVRAHTVGVSAGTPRSFATAPGTYSDANLDSADWAVYQAKQRGILLMVPVTDQWNYYHGGKGVFVHWAYQQNRSGLLDVPAPSHLFDADGAEKGAKAEDQFFSSSAGGLRIRALFKDYLSHWLNHVNPYTGLAYKDDPTIAIIETGNEIYSATAEWTEDIAAYIKALAPGKLVADGSAATGLAVANAPGLTAAHVDIVGAHYYAQDASWAPAPIMTLAGQLDRDVSAAQAAGKVFVLGEFPWTRADIGQWYAKVEGNKGIAADMTWAFVGGTEIHGGSFGSDDYPVHWPYTGAQEQQYAPALARHIGAVSGIAPSARARAISPAVHSRSATMARHLTVP